MVKSSSKVRRFTSSLGEELFTVFDFTIQNSSINQMNTRAIAWVLIHQVIVQHTASKCWVFKCFIKESLFCFCLYDHALGGIGYTTSIVLCYDSGSEHLLIREGRFSNYIIPHTESNHDVEWHGDIGLKENCAHWYDSSKHELYA